MDFCNWPIAVTVTQQTAGIWMPAITAAMTSLVAATGIYIAYRQWDTNRKKLKLELFEKRVVVYDAAKKAIAGIYTTGNSSQEIETQYLIGISGANWLFDEELVEFLDKKLWGIIVEIACTHSMYHGAPDGPERNLAIQHNAEAKNKLGEQLQLLDAKFGPYLKLDH
jgi:hypothetical protein